MDEQNNKKQPEADELSSEDDEKKQRVALSPIDYSNRMKVQYRIPFPSADYALTAMRTIGVDPAFLDSKTRKTTIRREMWIEELDDGIAYLNVVLSCIPTANDGKEVSSLRTC